MKTLRFLLPSALLLCLVGCPSAPDDDDFGRTDDDDDTVEPDDDDSATTDDDDDVQPDDDDVTPPPCEDDGLEPNDSQSDPSQYAADAGEQVACPEDEDWFVFDVAVGGSLSIEATYDVDEGRIELALFDAGSALLDSSAGTGGAASLDWSAVTDGTALRVLLLDDIGDDPGTTYELVAQTGDPPDVCETDPWEPNDTQGTASPIPEGVLDGLVACPEDQDWWLFELAQSEVLDIFVTFTHAEGDVDLALVDAGGTEVASATSSDDDETLSYEVVGAGPHALLVELVADSGDVPGNPYGLDLAITPAPDVCPVDLQEPNDSQGSAPTLAPGSYPDLSACSGDEDWYAIEVLADQVLDVTSVFDLAEGLVELSLFDSGAQLLVAGTPTLDGVELSWTTSVADTLALQAVLTTDSGDVGCPYSLDVTLTAAPAK